jgi:tetratricopeptide (TPR) repeat protein
MESSPAWRAATEAELAGRLGDAAKHYLAATSTEPLLARYRLGLILLSADRLRDAEVVFREALNIDPTFAAVRYNLAITLLALGRYQEAWPLHEARKELPETQPPSSPTAVPEWSGGPLGGMRLRVIAEQGLGDQIMFARFLKPLRALGAEVTYLCWPEVAPVLEGALAPSGRAPEADVWVHLASIPGLLGTTLETLPPPVEIVTSTSKSGGGIGVKSDGSSKHPRNALRSLFGTDRERLLSLGRDLSAEALAVATFAETAAIIAGLDLIVTVDTAVAHLAASMGKPTWILIQSQQPDWRWLRGRDDSPWYPSVRLFRQRVGEPWSAVLDRVEDALAVR